MKNRKHSILNSLAHSIKFTHYKLGGGEQRLLSFGKFHKRRQAVETPITVEYWEEAKEGIDHTPIVSQLRIDVKHCGVLQVADIQTSHYDRLLTLPTSRRILDPVNTR